MGYDPEATRRRYDARAEEEWLRLERDGQGELVCRVHLDVFREHVRPDDRVLEVGAGAGRYTKDLATMCAELTVADLSPGQLAFNRAKMEELGLSGRIRDFLELDLLDMGVFADAAFDVVVCVGGVVNYLMDRERDGIREMLRVLRPGGTLVLGSMSFISTALYYLSAVKAEKDLLGMAATRWIFDTGIQDGEHYPAPTKHYCHMMRSQDLDDLAAGFDVDVVERRGAGLFALGGEEAVAVCRADPELWNLIVAKEMEYSHLSTTLDCATNLIYVVQKR